MNTVYLAAQSLSAGDGGMSRVARLVALVLHDEVLCGRLSAEGLSLRDSAEPKKLGFPVHLMKNSKLRFVAAAHRAALRPSHFIYDSLSLARAHCRLPGAQRPFLAWILGIEAWENARPVHLRCARRADDLVAISRYSRDRAEALHGGFSRARVCWLGTESDEAPSIARQDAGPPTVLTVGRIDEDNYKGHDALIDCWASVTSQVPDARLVIVGTGPGLPTLRQLASSSPAATRIVFRGFVPEEEMDKTWSEATVFAMPSRGEGFGLVYIEAMRQGVPVVASIHDAAPEVNLDGVTGFNVDLTDSSALPERLISLLTNRDQSRELGLAGQKRWTDYFRFSAFRSRFLPILDEFLDSKR